MNTKYYMLTTKIETSVLHRMAYSIKLISTKHIDKRLEGEEVHALKEISKEQYKMYYAAKHMFVSGKLVIAN